MLVKIVCIHTKIIKTFYNKKKKFNLKNKLMPTKIVYKTNYLKNNLYLENDNHKFMVYQIRRKEGNVLKINWTHFIYSYKALDVW